MALKVTEHINASQMITLHILDSIQKNATYFTMHASCNQCQLFSVDHDAQSMCHLLYISLHISTIFCQHLAAQYSLSIGQQIVNANYFFFSKKFI